VTHDLPYVCDLGNPAQTIENCMDLCLLSGYHYAGLQYYDQCYCGDDFDTYGQVDDESCSDPCSGNSAQMCGGDWLNSVYAAPYGDDGGGVHNFNPQVWVTGTLSGATVVNIGSTATNHLSVAHAWA